jgi:hypothetical protein
MVRALLDGRKTQTRRVLKNQPETEAMAHPVYQEHFSALHVPYAPGDRLWVREAWRTNAMWDRFAPSALTEVSRQSGRVSVLFEAGGALPGSVEASDAGRYRHARFMPRWASRLTLAVTDVRVERLQEISEADAIAEGAPRLWMDDEDKFHEGGPLASHRCGFMGLWDHINGPGAWEANPWILAVTFVVRKGNIDG